MKRILVLWILVIFLLGACSRDAGGIQVRDAWTRPAMMGSNSAIYFVIQNNAGEEDELTGVTSDVAQAVEMHETKMEVDVMQMQQVMSIPLAGNAKVEFAPGGLHVMLIGLKQELQAGEEIEVTLQFANHEDITLTVPVQERAGDASLNDH